MHRGHYRRQLRAHRRPLRHQVDGKSPLHGSPPGRVDRCRGELAADGGRKVLVCVPGDGAQTGRDRAARAVPHRLHSDLRRRRHVLCRPAAGREVQLNREHQDRVVLGDGVGQQEVAVLAGARVRDAEGEDRAVRHGGLRLAQQNSERTRQTDCCGAEWMF